jgi:hypothetical protein
MNSNILKYIIMPMLPLNTILFFIKEFDIYDIIDFICDKLNINIKNRNDLTNFQKYNELKEYSKLLCHKCNHNRGFIHKYIPFNIRLCKYCYSDVNYRLISNIQLKRKYNISDSLLKPLPKLIIKSKFKLCDPIIFYRECDIIDNINLNININHKSGCNFIN